MSSNSQIQEILLRYLNGESSSAETEAVLQWINESKANADEFELLKRLWLDSAEVAVHRMDVDRAWRNVHAQTIERQPRAIAMFPWKKAILIAASIVLIISAYFVFNRSSKTNWTEVRAVDMNKQIQLPDGTAITLRKGSRLSMPDDFGKGGRQVKLEGEAYFEIRHDAQNPFFITTSKSVIQDIGTAFLVQSHDSLEQVTVVEGAVSFAAKGQKQQELKLQAGESAVLEKALPERRMVKTANLLSWKSKTLTFNHTPLAEAAKDLENYYLINVQTADGLGSIQITARFKNEPLDQVIKELQLLTALRFQLKENTLFITKS
ncbi:MAG TPA: FecR domain-containing protein [Flavisolibacter sp.]|nr:FecR domain-containing protein [Flavisolibacter sp.]